ncbi:MAG TPA: ABC transporter ATP-binding protein, partial [Bacillota bacterium]|nr:ABC transporter ATP-binding protein [Bacillota bacterium]
GCGKTTLLNILAGLTGVECGRVMTTPEVAYLFQEPRLVPWLTVRENLCLVLRDKLPGKSMNERVDQYLTALGLEAYQDYYPAQLSGGFRQRVALARAFSYPARLLLMDEPFKSLDLKTRFRLIADFLELWRQEPRTVIAVTHDVKEAVLLGEKLVVLSDKPTRVLKELEVEPAREERSESQMGVIEQELWELLLQ